MANPYRNKSGIYCIIHLASGQLYIGQAQDIAGRWSTHLAELARGRHHCQHLQRAWNKYGADAFVFRALRFSPIDLLDAHETEFCNRNRGRLYNTRPPGKSCRGFKHPPEVVARMSEAAKLVSRSVEGRRQRSENAKRMHQQGRIPSRPFADLVRVCRKCGNKFERPKFVGKGRSASFSCLPCQAEAFAVNGGQFHLDKFDVSINDWDYTAYELTALKEYKYNRVLLGEGRPKQLYRGAK